MNKKKISKNEMFKKQYGKEVILDLYNCNEKKFTRKTLKRYFIEICDLIDMERCDLHWWDDIGLPKKERETEPHLKGTSAIQFIRTSNITIHTLDILKRVYLNIFSCKNFDEKIVRDFTAKWFEGKVVNYKVMKRK
jgi:S-adenosylmethionine/arginine decarboxylase-like enzyme